MKLKIKFFVFYVLTYNLVFAQTGKEVSKSWFSGITSQVIVVAVFVSLLFAFLTLFLASKLFNDSDSEVPNNVKNYVKRKIDEAQLNKNESRAHPNSLELQVQDANSRIRDLESHIEKIKTQLNTSNPVSSYTAQTIQPTYQETEQPEVKTETFFLSTPNADGSFNESSASSAYKDGASIYRFTKIGNDKAKFQIDEKDASARLALQFPDKNIDPVCDAVNAFNPKATRIITVEQGEAELQNGKWIVEKNKKTKIKYEN